MKILRRIILFILIGLGVAAGAAKIMLMPEEIELFRIAGFGEILLQFFGLLQVASALSIVFVRIRKPGAIILAVTFGISTVLIFLGGQVAFGIFSVVPILLIGIVINDKSKIFSLNTEGRAKE